ncbi:MAG: DUF5916 domain-containing protein [Vicinamibacterales bacterium]
MNVLRPTACSAAAFLLTALVAGEVSAQQAAAPVTPPQVRAIHVETPPVLDGNVQDDPAWAMAPAADEFWQIRPVEGEAASERTEVRFVYTDSTLYIGLIAHDRSPEGIIVAESRRDSSLTDTDSLLVIFDTYSDRQNGFVFGTNPAGIQYDGQVVNEGGGGAGPGGGTAQGGSGGGFNLNWDGSWEVRTAASDTGWTAEFAIPFRTLRYARDGQTWGLNIQRNIRRRNETSFWSPIPRQYDLYRLSLAGQLQGLEIPTQRNLQVTPYFLTQARQRGNDLSETDGDTEWGADMKYGITPSLTLDLTYNTDFAQVEVDEQQVNLDRFTLFFPEKRPFFLENAGLFAVGSPREAEVFFSRSIGIGREDAQPIPIIAGARLTGQLGSTRIGLMNIQTDDVRGIGTIDNVPQTNFAVARVQHELPNRSALGAIFVNRQDMGDFAEDDAYNRSYAVDGRLGIGSNGQIQGFLAKTSTPDVDDDQHAFQLDSTYNSQAWSFGLGYSEVGDNFNPEVGFLSRGGFRKANVSVFHRYRPTNFGPFQELRPHSSFQSYWDFTGFQETMRWHLDQHWEMRAGHEFHTGFNMTREGLKEPFTIFPGVVVPPGSYAHNEAQLVFFTNRGAPISFNMMFTGGGFFGGTRAQTTPSITARIGETFNTTLSWARNNIDLPWGEFTTNLIQSRVSYSFTPEIFVQSLIQYNDRADVWSTNLRFGWYLEGSTGLFVVYNDTQGLDGSPLLRADRSFTVKLSRLFNVLD